MIGKKIALKLLDEVAAAGALNLPEQEKEDAEEDGKDAHADRLGLLENLDDAVHECSNPQEPFEQRGKHEWADDGDIDDLLRLDCECGA
jgi:hypothetical protein